MFGSKAERSDRQKILIIEVLQKLHFYRSEANFAKKARKW